MDGALIASPHHHSSSHIPAVRSSHILQHTGHPQTALPCPLEAIPKDRAFIYLLQSPGWASGCSKGRRISRKMVPGDGGRCHIIKQALSLSSHHPVLTQVRFSGHRNLPTRPWNPFSPCRVKPIFSRCLQESLMSPTQQKLSVVCSQFFLPRGHPLSVLHHLQQLSLLWPRDPHEALCAQSTKTCSCTMALDKPPPPTPYPEPQGASLRHPGSSTGCCGSQHQDGSCSPS